MVASSRISFCEKNNCTSEVASNVKAAIKTSNSALEFLNFIVWKKGLHGTPA